MSTTNLKKNPLEENTFRNSLNYMRSYIVQEIPVTSRYFTKILNLILELSTV